ncbi:hypothetical protein KBC75_00105 [Candidatus Shapirobacteria bacterium]|nr:hypothetical protein [Candidatus Shapirobacteria bacterium]
MASLLTNSYSTVKPLYDYLQKQRENQRFTKAIEIGATFFLISFFLIFAIRPTMLTISALLGDIKSKELSNLQMKNKIDDVMRAQDAFSTIQERFQIVESSLPSRPNYFQSYNEVQTYATSSGIKIDSLVLGLDDTVDKLNPKIKTYSTAISVNQPFDIALKLVSDLLNGRRLLSINGINFTVTEKDNSGDPGIAGLVNTTFSPTFYFWNETNEKK